MVGDARPGRHSRSQSCLVVVFCGAADCAHGPHAHAGVHVLRNTRRGRDRWHNKSRGDSQEGGTLSSTVRVRVTPVPRACPLPLGAPHACVHVGRSCGAVEDTSMCTARRARPSLRCRCHWHDTDLCARWPVLDWAAVTADNGCARWPALRRPVPTPCGCGAHNAWASRSPHDRCAAQRAADANRRLCGHRARRLLFRLQDRRTGN